jgi:hypothetical protein
MGRDGALSCLEYLRKHMCLLHLQMSTFWEQSQFRSQQCHQSCPPSATYRMQILGSSIYRQGWCTLILGIPQRHISYLHFSLCLFVGLHESDVLTASPDEFFVRTITVANTALDMPSTKLELPSNQVIVYTCVGMVHCHA